MAAVNTGQLGATDATRINFFIMWISTMMVCIANYNNTRAQALKDQNLEEVNTYLSKISVEDELTGIHNMVYFRTEAEKLLNYVTTDRESIIFLFFDIENFKSYNEKYGFHAGNDLLKRIAHMIDAAFSSSLVSRFSDDHFVVLTREDGVQNVIGEISGEVKKLQREVHLELKCGAYKPVGDEADVSLACDRARFACNSIKKHYDRTIQLYDKSLEDKFRLKQYIVNNIDTAIENDYIKVYYQPIVSTKTSCICGLEALARWQDPNYGLLSPGMFIEILEEYRQIYKLDKYIIEAVCKDYRDSVDNNKPFAPVSLNFSRLDFELCDIVGYLCEMVEKYNVPKEFVDIEITESALTVQQDFLPNAIKALRNYGYKIWLDDFGSGYSSLNVLKDYQFDVLKIDMKFLSGFKENKKTRPILENIVDLTKQLKMVSLTEGVETKEQFDFLGNIGCERAQGYLFSKPVPLEELRKRIDSGELNVCKETKSA
jgi:diguanylate cyclase (GGDEF)-like protein